MFVIAGRRHLKMLREPIFNLDQFSQTLACLSNSPQSTRGYDELFSSSTSECEMDLEYDDPPLISDQGRVVDRLEKELDMGAHAQPSTTSNLYDDDELSLIGFAYSIQGSEAELRVGTPFFPCHTQNLTNHQWLALPCETPTTPSLLHETASTMSTLSPRAKVNQPDKLSAPSQEIQPDSRPTASPVAFETENEIATPRQHLKRTFQESQSLLGLEASTTSPNDKAETSRKRLRCPISTDKSFSSLFLTVKDPVSGAEKTEQQVFPRALWPIPSSRKGISDLLLTSLSAGEVRIVTIARQSKFEIVTEQSQIFATILQAKKGDIEVLMNDSQIKIASLDSFKLPKFSRATIVNHSKRTKAQVQLVALNS